MFCTRHLMELAVHVFDSIDCPVTIECFSGKLNCDRIKTELKNGACLLVAYPFFAISNGINHGLICIYFECLV